MTGFFENLKSPLSPAQLNDWLGKIKPDGQPVTTLGDGAKPETVFRHELSITIATVTSAVYKNNNGEDKNGFTDGTEKVLFDRYVYKNTNNAASSDNHKDALATQWKGLTSILFQTADQVIQIIGYKADIAQPEDNNDSLAPANVPGSSSFGELFDPKHDQGIRHWSPILMLGSSLGSVYAFYPAITPYMLMDIDEANDLDQWIQFISSIPTLVIGFLDEFDVGPGGISAGIWGNLVNDVGDTDGASAAKGILEESANEATLSNVSAWTGDRDEWTQNANHKTGINTKLDDVTGAQPTKLQPKLT